MLLEDIGRPRRQKASLSLNQTVGDFLIRVDCKNVTYFRGRKLHGKTVKIPEGYKGVILSSTDQKLHKEPRVSEEEEELDENEQSENIGILEEQAEFDEVMFWGHEALPDESTDPYVRGVEEWITFAEQVGSGPTSVRSTDSFRSTHTLHTAVMLRKSPNSLELGICIPAKHSAELVYGLGLNSKLFNQLPSDLSFLLNLKQSFFRPFLLTPAPFAASKKTFISR